MKYNILFVIFPLLCSLGLFSQSIENIRFEQAGKQINIYYDLMGGQASDTYEVSVFC